MTSMPDQLPPHEFLIAGGRWDFQTLGAGHDRTVWVEGMHWPGCDDVVGHSSIGFGVQRSDKFLQFNSSFWDELGLDYTLVREVAKRMQQPGDPGDVAAPPVPNGAGPEVRLRLRRRSFLLSHERTRSPAFHTPKGPRHDCDFTTAAPTRTSLEETF